MYVCVCCVHVLLCVCAYVHVCSDVCCVCMCLWCDVHPYKIFAAPIGTATRNTIYTQQGAKPACQQHISTEFSQLLLVGAATPHTIYTQQGAKPPWQERINTKYSQLLLEQRPRTQFTHSKAPNPHASNTSTQNFRSSYWHSYPEHNLHTARLQTRMPATHPHKIFAAPIGTATPNTIYTQQGSKPACQQCIHTKRRQSVHRTPCRCSKSHACRAKAAAERRRPNDAEAYIGPLCRCSKSHACHAKAAAERRRPNDAKAYIRPPCRCSKPHACHAKAAAERRRPNDAKAYIRPPAAAPIPTPAAQKQRRRPNDAKAYIRPPADAPSPTPATQKAAAEPRRPNDAKAYIRSPEARRRCAWGGEEVPA